MNEMQARHKGVTDRRTWHKIRWTGGRYAGRFDLFTDEDLKGNKDAEIVETFQTEMCAAGVAFGFGRSSEEQIDKWIRENRR